MMLHRIFSILIFLVFFLNQASAGSLWDKVALVKAEKGMVAAQEKLATQVGIEILKQGGNAIDAAVAMGYTMAVTFPEAGSLGGGGFMLVYLAEKKEVFAINYREAAPEKAHRDMFLDENGEVDPKKSRHSLLSSGVPGTVAGLNLAHQQFGKLDFKTVLKPAIHLAKEGFVVSDTLGMHLDKFSNIFSYSPAAKKTFFVNGLPLKAGEILKQPELAQTLDSISEVGSKAFYTGWIAKAIQQAMLANGGLIGQSDLHAYRAALVQPLEASFQGYRIYSMPPPSSGGVALLQLLSLSEFLPLKQHTFHHPESVHLLVEAMNYVYADRSDYLGDPNFFPTPVKALLSPQHLKSIRSSLNPLQHDAPEKVRKKYHAPMESENTTHFSVIDQAGNMVSNTYTLNSLFGNGYMVPNTGILMNNEMDDFSAKAGVPNQFGVIGGKANAIEPGKRPLSSMTPVIVLDTNKNPILSTGSPGGSRIITTVFQVLLNTLIYGMDIAEAANAPRFHSQLYPNEIRIETPFDTVTTKALKEKGHLINTHPVMGSVQTVMKTPDGVLGASDTRRGGQALGY